MYRTKGSKEAKKRIPLCPASSMKELLEKEGLLIEEYDEGDNEYGVNDDVGNGNDYKDEFGAYNGDEDGLDLGSNEVDEGNCEDERDEQNEDEERDERYEEAKNQIGLEQAELQNVAASSDGKA